MNPVGSIKARPARYLLEGLQRDGRIAGKRIVEPTSGNTGIALAALSNLLGIPCTITIPSGAPEEKIALLRLLGAEVWPTPDDLCPVDHPKDGAIALARTFIESRTPGILDRSLVDKTVRVPDQHAYRTTIRLARAESLLAGASTGAIVWAALQEDLPPGTVSVCISPDNAFKYVSFLAEYVAGDGVPEGSLSV